ncbi:hypothetical protein [Acetobacter sp.]|uniref:hypothetical protein n=1 Tax=Acetobacter sp. TaxID=440 RepID=UPI0039E95F52
MSGNNKIYTNLVLSFLVGIILSGIPLLIDGNAYYRDDMQTQYMPTFYSIGSMLLNYHQIPFMTTHSWFGGNIVGEFQYGIFNPVELVLYSFLPIIQSLSGGAGFLAVIHYGMLSSGIFFLSRTLGISNKYSYIAAITVVLNNFIFYWFAESWFPEFSSIAFMVWAVAFVFRAKDSKWDFLAAVVATYLTITSGFPQTIVAFGLCGLIYSGMEIYQNRNLPSCLPFLSLCLGGMAALMAVVPTLAMVLISDRTKSDMTTVTSMIPSLGDLLAVFNPIHPSHILYPTEMNIKVSIYYVAWFVLPALIFTNWQSVRRIPQKNICIFIYVIVFLVLTQGAGGINVMKLPIRFAVFFQIFLTLATLYLWSHYRGKELSKVKVYSFILVLIVTGIMSILQYPHKIIGIALAVALCVYFGLKFAQKDLSLAKLIAMTLVLAVVSRVSGGGYNHLFPKAILYPEISQNINLNTTDTDYNMCLIYDVYNDTWIVKGSDYIKYIWFGNMGLVSGRPSVNGYSPIKQYALQKRFFRMVQGFTPIESGIAGLELESSTGMSFFDLMRVKNVIATNGPQVDVFMREKPSDWQELAATNPYTRTFSHTLPNEKLPGTLSWPVNGVSVVESSTASAALETLAITSRSKGVNRLIFARTSWPGYEAVFNGVSVPVSTVAGFLLAVDLPDDGSTGIVQLTYHVPGIRITLPLFGLSIVLTILIMNMNFLWNGLYRIPYRNKEEA